MAQSNSIAIRLPVLWIALSLSTLAHLSFVMLDTEHYAVDSSTYLIPADNLLHGLGFVNAAHQPELRRTPGYPLLLSIFRAAPLRVEYLIVLQHLLCVLLTVTVAAFALRVSGSALVALTATIVLSLDLATLRIANLLMTETLSTVLIALAAWSLYRAILSPAKRMAASLLAGFLCGCATLVRPACLLYFVPLSLCLFLAYRGRAVRPVLALLISFALLPFLWAARNFVQGQYFGLSTIGAEDLLYYRAAGALAIRQPGVYLQNTVQIRDRLIDQTCGDLEREYGRDCSQITEPQRAAYASHKGIEIIEKYPFSYARSMFRSLCYIVFGGGAEALTRLTGLSPRTAELLVLLLTVPEAGLVVVGCWYWHRIDPRLFYLLILTVAYFLLISAGAEGYSRFRVPAMPMYALLAGGGAAEIVMRVQRVRASRSLGSTPIATQSR